MTTPLLFVLLIGFIFPQHASSFSYSNNLHSETVRVLKQMCKEKGLKVSGKKADLIARLSESAPQSIPSNSLNLESSRKSKSRRLASSKIRIADEDLLSDNLVNEPADDFPDFDGKKPFSHSQSKIKSSLRTRIRRSEHDAIDVRIVQGSEKKRIDLRKFGILGHDYKRCEDDISDISLVPGGLKHINSLLAERLAAKLAQDYDRADAVKAELATVGVVVHDGCKAWRADGDEYGFQQALNRAAENSNFRVASRNGELTSGSDNHRSQSDGDSSMGVYVYTRSDDGEDRPDLDEEAAVALINKRGWLKLNGAFAEADAVREELRKVHRVVVNDRSKSWVALTPAGHPHRPLQGKLTTALVERARGGKDSSTGRDFMSRVDALLSLRYTAKQQKRFAHADAAQEELRKMGIEVDDFGFSWRYNAGSTIK